MKNTSNNTFQNEPPKLLDQVRGKIRLKHYSIRTEQAYLDWIKRFILHSGKRHPSEFCCMDTPKFSTKIVLITHFFG